MASLSLKTSFERMSSFFCSSPAKRWSTTRSSKVNLHHAITLRALCGANLVTYPPDFRKNETLTSSRSRGCRASSAPHLPKYARDFFQHMPSDHQLMPSDHQRMPSDHEPMPSDHKLEASREGSDEVPTPSQRYLEGCKLFVCGILNAAGTYGAHTGTRCWFLA